MSCYTCFLFKYEWFMSSASTSSSFLWTGCSRNRFVMSCACTPYELHRGKQLLLTTIEQTFLCGECGLTVVTHHSGTTQGAGVLELQHRQIICQFDIMQRFCNAIIHQSATDWDSSTRSMSALPQQRQMLGTLTV